MTRPPGNSLAAAQADRVVDEGDDLAAGVRELLSRIGEELDFNDAKGAAPYRLGAHDALRFAEDALVDLLRRHGHHAAATQRDLDA